MNELKLRNNSEKELFKSQHQRDFEIRMIKKTMIKSNEEFRCNLIIEEMNKQNFGVMKK